MYKQTWFSTLQSNTNFEHNVQIKNYIKSSKPLRKIYHGTSKGTSKQRYENQKKSFNNKQRRADTELSKEYSRIKEFKAQPQVKLYFLKKIPTSKKNSYLLFMFERKTVYHWTPKKRPYKPKNWTYQ